MARKKRRIIVRDRKKTAVRIAAVIIALIVLAGIAVLAFFTARSCGKKLTTRTLPLIASDLLTGTGDGILYLRGGMLEYYSFKDEDLNFSSPLTGVPEGLVGTSGVKAVYSQDAVQMIGAPFEIVPEGSIVAVRCGRTHLAVCTRRPNGDESLCVYNSTGQPVYSLSYQPGRLMNFGFSEVSSASLWTMELDTDSGSPRTTVTTFDLDRMSSTGVITVSGQLVEDIFFTESSVFIIGTDSLIRYSASANREIYRVRLYGYRVIDRTFSEGSPTLLLVPRSVPSVTEAVSVRLLTVSQKDVADETAVTVTLPEGLVGCHLANGSLIVTTPTSVQLYDARGRRTEKLVIPEGSTISSEKLDEHHILLERSGEFVLLTAGK